MMEPRQQYKTGGYTFNLHKYELLLPTKKGTARCKAIYKDDRDKSNTNVEVVIMTWGLPHPMSASKESYFGMPATSEWGNKGWSFRDLGAAEIKYNSIGINDEEE